MLNDNAELLRKAINWKIEALTSHLSDEQRTHLGELQAAVDQAQADHRAATGAYTDAVGTGINAKRVGAGQQLAAAAEKLQGAKINLLAAQKAFGLRD
jgi:hypothetical protein